MACDSTSAYRLEAVNAQWGKEHLVKVVGMTGLVGGEHFLISSQDVDYYVWFKVNSVGTDPAVAGKTAILAELPTSYTLADLYAELLDVLDTTGKKFYADTSADGTYLCVSTMDIGTPKSVAAAGTSTFTITILTQGLTIDLGQTSEGVEVTFEPTLFDISPNQTGVTIADQIIQGFNVACSMGIIQLTEDRWQKLVGAGMGNTIVSGAKTLVGFGTGKNFESSFQYAGRLILHPVRLAAASRDEDINIWKCLPSAESVTYSGTDLLTMALSFSALVDTGKATAINIMARGDSSLYLK